MEKDVEELEEYEGLTEEESRELLIEFALFLKGKDYSKSKYNIETFCYEMYGELLDDESMNLLYDNYWSVVRTINKEKGFTEPEKFDWFLFIKVNLIIIAVSYLVFDLLLDGLI